MSPQVGFNEVLLLPSVQSLTQKLIEFKAGFSHGLLKPLTPMSRSYLFVCRVISAMLGLGLMNAAIIFVFLGKFPQPGAAGDFFAGYGADPDIIPALFFPIVKNIYPLQNIFPTFGPPAADIL